MSRYREQTTAPMSAGRGPGESGLGQAQLTLAYWSSRNSLPSPLSVGVRDVLIGRDVRAPDGLTLEDLKASRLHARICWDPRGGGHRLGDAGSSNGSYVNGERVQTQLLQPGDVIRIGTSLMVYDLGDPMADVRSVARRVARSECNVLLQGETGVGKEVVAHLIHEQSACRGEFVPVNCAALPHELIGSELFGHARGAFSGAERARGGLFVAADGGTLFLDEVGDLPLGQQPVLLRAIEEHRVRPLGTDREVPVSARILAATQVDLERAVAAGGFRSDLLARLAQVTLRLPPLRERRGQVLALLHEFLEAAGRPAELTVEAAEALLLWSWPHNVREVHTLAAAFAAIADADALFDLVFLQHQKPRLVTPDSAPPPSRGGSVSGRGDRERLKSLLLEHGGNVAAVARALGKPRTHVYRWVKRFGLSPGDYRG